MPWLAAAKICEPQHAHHPGRMEVMAAVAATHSCSASCSSRGGAANWVAPYAQHQPGRARTRLGRRAQHPACAQHAHGQAEDALPQAVHHHGLQGCAAHAHVLQLHAGQGQGQLPEAGQVQGQRQVLRCGWGVGREQEEQPLERRLREGACMRSKQGLCNPVRQRPPTNKTHAWCHVPGWQCAGAPQRPP